MRKLTIFALCCCILLTACSWGRPISSSQEPEAPVSGSLPESSQGNREPEADDVLHVDFTDGPKGTNRASLAVGDAFLGLTLNRLEAEYNDGELWMLQADFTGEVTLKGRLYYENLEGPNLVRFEVAEESQSLLPCPVGIERQVWFGFTDEAAVKDMAGQEFFDWDCEIVIDAYNIHFAYAGVWDTASLVSIQK